MNGLNGKPLGDSDVMRYCFEVRLTFFKLSSNPVFQVATLISVFAFMIIQQGGEIKNAGLNSFRKNLVEPGN